MGSGYRVFTAGEVLTASNVQNYLQDQAVMVFGGTAARSSAIGTANFEEGMLTYLTDVDKLQVYTGAAFADVYPAAASNQGLTLINTTSFSAVASQSINDVFSATYQNYRIILNSDFGGSSDLRFRLRVGGTDASGSNYTYNVFFGNSVGATGVDLNSTGTTSTSLGYQSTTLRGNWIIDIYSPFETKATVYNALSSRTDQFCVIFGGHSLNNSYTGFTFIPTTSMTGQVSVYGYNK